MALLNLRRVGVRNFRCFGDEEQSGRLAPLTLLVGDNSTGKTSLLAMIRILWHIAFRDAVADFKDDPYDLGSFDEIVHRRGSRSSSADTFEASFVACDVNEVLSQRPVGSRHAYRVSSVFERGATAPTLSRRYFERGQVGLEEHFAGDELREAYVRTPRGYWRHEVISVRPLAGLSSHIAPDTYSEMSTFPLSYRQPMIFAEPTQGYEPVDESPWIALEDLKDTAALLSDFRIADTVPYASAPVRSKPRRTYDPARVAYDPEGDFIPMYLADIHFRDPEGWLRLQSALEDFGRGSGLFDELRVRRLGKRASEPFQLQVRKSGSKRLKGPWYNLIDVGYGVSQVLPLATELLREGCPDTFLLQQPEVHLHPSAQAALGSLLGARSVKGKQIIVETHSDHLIDRVRMDVRDKKSGLTPEHLSILYFERKEFDVHIHSLKVDEEGNLWKVDEKGDLVNVPESYRRFFMEETRRFLGF